MANDTAQIPHHEVIVLGAGVAGIYQIHRLAELAGWDRDILAIELQALSDMELDFDLEITGFETAEGAVRRIRTRLR